MAAGADFAGEAVAGDDSAALSTIRGSATLVPTTAAGAFRPGVRSASAFRPAFDRIFNSIVFGEIFRRCSAWRLTRATAFAPRIDFLAVAAAFLALFTRLLAAFCNLAVAPLRCPFAAARFAFAVLAPVVLAPVGPRRAGGRDDAFVFAARFLALRFRTLAAEPLVTGRFRCDRAVDIGFALAVLALAELDLVLFFGDFLCVAMANLSKRDLSPTPVVGPTIYERHSLGQKHHTCDTLAMPEAAGRHPQCRPA